MKKHILQSIIETAKQPTNIMGMAAMNQLIIEVISEFPEVRASGFIFQESRPAEGQPHHHYSLIAALIDPWPLEQKLFCGTGFTPCEAMKSLRAELVAYFVPVVPEQVLVCEEVLSHQGQPIPDRRTEYAA